MQEIVFLTESKIRAKQLRKDGYEPTKRRKAVEAHYDDLGDDLSGFGGDLSYLFANYFPAWCDSEPIESQSNLLRTGFEHLVTGMRIYR